MYQVIQLQPSDDILAIRARIENAEFAHIVLVVPRACAFLESASGLQLLRRAADDLGAQIALVAYSEDVRERAAEYGFPIFNSLRQVQSAHWKMQPPARATTHRAANVPPPAPPELVADAFLARILREWRVTILALASALILICVAAIIFVPTAQVYLIPAPMVLTTTTDILIDSSNPTVSSATRSIPARRILLETSGTASVRTTTTKTIPDARSTGTVVFTNLRAEETIVPQGIVVVTSAGVPIRFTTTNTVTVPSGVGARAEAPIQAVDPGPAGNVKELSINAVEGSMALSVRVINTQPTVSGSLRPVRVVTEADKKKLEEQLLAQLKQGAPKVLQSAL
ncbi:MAG: baseplate J/gp47 family protein, partial [Chloroflexota bacterium]